MLTQKRLKEVLHYNPDNGLFYWLVARQRINVGQIAGYTDSRGYITIAIDGGHHKAHRLAWVYTHGYFPEHGMDHLDRNKSNNCIENLREVSQSCNMRNTGNPKNNSSGVKGVSFCNRTGKWHTKIVVPGKQHFLGYYKSFHNAACARLAAEQCLGWEGCDSSSPAYKYVKEMLIST